jgi:hypothetical protein
MQHLDSQLARPRVFVHPTSTADAKRAAQEFIAKKKAAETLKAQADRPAIAPVPRLHPSPEYAQAVERDNQRRMEARATKASAAGRRVDANPHARPSQPTETRRMGQARATALKMAQPHTRHMVHKALDLSRPIDVAYSADMTNDVMVVHRNSGTSTRRRWSVLPKVRKWHPPT